MTRDYALALVEILVTGTPYDEVMSSFDAMLQKRGLLRLRGTILQNVLRELEARAKQAVPTLTVAKASDIKNKLVDELMSTLAVPKGTKPEVVVDDTIIGGATLRYQNTEIDASYKTALLRLYDAVITK